MPPKLNRVIRLDSLPLNQTFFTPEGYLVDRPIVTSTGIFEYHNNDGTVRRELRLPEEVFSAKSLASYKGKPIIMTHDAGLIDKSNVGKHQVGTILSEGYRSGDDVRAEIVINDTDEMKRFGFKELSLGYNLDLDETPGEWNGQKYDAVQRNITINHLAIVKEARAGDQARLNIDSRDKTPKGVKVMANTKKNVSRADGTLSPEEFSKAIEEYKARRAQMAESAKDAEDAPVQDEPVQDVPAAPAQEAPVQEAPVQENPEMEQDAEEAPVPVNPKMAKKEAVPAKAEAPAAAPVEEQEPSDDKKTIAQMDEDMSILFDIIDTLLAEREFKQEKPQEQGQPQGQPQMPMAQGDSNPDQKSKMPFDKMSTLKADAEMPVEEELQEEELVEDEDDEEIIDETMTETSAKPEAKQEDVMVPEKLPSKMNADAVDQIVRQRIQIGIVGDRLNMDGLEEMPIKEAKKAIIHAVRPSIRLDGKSDIFTDKLFNMACMEIRSRKSTDFQKQQMFNKKSRMDADDNKESAAFARQKMINRFQKKED